MRAGQRILIIRSWLWRAAMTVEAFTPLRGVEMWEVDILLAACVGFNRGGGRNIKYAAWKYPPAVAVSNRIGWFVAKEKAACC